MADDVDYMPLSAPDFISSALPDVVEWHFRLIVSLNFISTVIFLE